MAEVTLTVCDPCHKSGELTLGYRWRVHFEPPGEEAQTIEIFLGKCAHGDLAMDFLEMCEDFGTKVPGVPYQVLKGEPVNLSLPEPEKPRGSELSEQHKRAYSRVYRILPLEEKQERVEARKAAAFFAYVEEVRLKRGITGIDLQRKSKVGRSTLFRWRDGEYTPRPAQVSAITLVLGLNRERVRQLTGVSVPLSMPEPPAPAPQAPQEPSEPTGEATAPEQTEAAPEPQPPLFSDPPQGEDWNAAGLERAVEEIAKAAPSHPLKISNPEWAREVRAKCKVETGKDPLDFPVYCNAELLRSDMGNHARRAHNLPSAYRAKWELIGMPEGVDPAECPDCALPFPTQNMMNRHQMKCPVRRGDAVPARGGTYRRPRPVEPSRHRHMVGRTFGNNPVIGTAGNVPDGL